MNIIRTKRKSIAIIIKNNKEIEIRAPYKMSTREILNFVEEKQDWIKKNLAKQKPLKDYKAILDEFLGEDRNIESAKKKALNKILPRVRYFLDEKNILKDERRPGRVLITNAKSRWGSCSSKNNINFSWRLCLCPESVIDYVVVHELCHIINKNHAKEFWNLVEESYPAYKSTRKWLKENSGILDLEII